jgi:predicted PurR-regulated permease PerM
MATRAEPAWRSSATPLLAVVVATTVLYLAREVVIPFALAVLLAFLLAPLVRRFESLRLWRVPSVLLSVALGMAVVSGVGWVAADQAVSLAGKLPEYKDNISRKMKDLRAQPSGDLGKAAKAIKELEGEAADEPSQAPAKPKAQKPQVNVPTTPLEIISTLGVPLAALLLGTIAVVVITTLMLLQRHDLRDRLVRLVGEGQVHVTTQAMEDAGGRVSRYLLSLLVVNLCYGLPIGVALYFIGIPNALLWGLLSTVLRFIPYIGAPAAAIMPVALAFAIGEGWGLVAWTVGAIVAVDLVIAYVVEPWLYGARTGLSPIAIVLGAIFWTWLWGPFGLLLATPITVCIVVVARYIPNLEFLSIILSADPVLPPPVRFYQRLVALEYDDAYDLAEHFAREQGLAALYDCVLMPALVLAKRDRQRHSLDEERERFIVDSMLRIVEELGEGAPAGAAHAHALCIVPAHDDADQVAGVMLARLLVPEHCHALVIPRALLAAEILDRVAETCDQAVLVSAVPPAAATNSSYLCKRLRNRFPQMKIIVALWNAETDNLARATERLHASGANEVVTTLSSALERIRLVTPAARIAG